MKNNALKTCLMILLATPTVVFAEEPQLSGMALQQIQAKDFETTSDVAFPAVMTVLQDDGYRILTAQKDTGLITAIGSEHAHLIWAPFLGFRQKKKVPMVSVFIEQRGVNNTRIRLSFVMSTAKTNLMSDEKPISDPEPYRLAFEKIAKEIFVRQSLNASTPKAENASPLDHPNH